MAKRKAQLNKRRKAAANKLKRKTTPAPRFTDNPDLVKARGLWARAQYDQALKLFNQIVKSDPTNVIALVDAARAYGARFELHKAEQYLDRAIKLAPDRPEILHLAGQSYRMIHRPGKALDCLRRVVEQGADVPDAYLELGMLCDRRNQLDEAMSVIDQLIGRTPNYVEARVIKGVLLGRTGQSSEAETILRDVAADDSAHWHTQARAWAELAKLLDRQSQFDDAFEAASRSKRILSQHFEHLLSGAQRQLSRYRRLHASMNADYVKKWRSETESLDPKKIALLTGPPRSGTTLLEKAIDAHPGVISSDEREAFPRFVFQSLVMESENDGDLSAARLDEVPHPRLIANRHQYLNFMEASLDERIGKRIHIDKNPSITSVLPGVLRLFPECRIIYALRDPRDLVISTYLQFFAVNNNSVAYFSLEGTALRYAEEAGMWLKLRDLIPDGWIEARYEDTINDLPDQAQRVLSFLGLDWDERVCDYREHLKTRQTDSPTYADVAQPIYRNAVGRWRNYEKHLEPVLAHLEPFLRAFEYDQ